MTAPKTNQCVTIYPRDAASRLVGHSLIFHVSSRLTRTSIGTRAISKCHERACHPAASSGILPSMEAEIDCKLQSDSR
jgi:hypothetical protein